MYTVINDLKTNRMIMKKIFLAVTIAALFAACNGKPKETVVLVDTTAIKQKAISEEQARVKAERDARNNEAAARRRAENRNTSNSANNNTGTSVTPASSGSGGATEAPARRGMSSAAKGTLIGAGAGAIAGGIIGHNLKGAAIGAAAGAGTGYIIGRSKDRKSGRVVKKPVE